MKTTKQMEDEFFHEKELIQKKIDVLLDELIKKDKVHLTILILSLLETVSSIICITHEEIYEDTKKTSLKVFNNLLEMSDLRRKLKHENN